MTNDDFPDPAERLRAFAQLLAGGQQNGDQNTPADENTMNVMAELFNNPDYQRLMMAQSMPSTPQTPVQHSMAPAAANPENPAFRALVGLHNAQAAGFPLGVYPNMVSQLFLHKSCDRSENMCILFKLFLFSELFVD